MRTVPEAAKERRGETAEPRTKAQMSHGASDWERVVEVGLADREQIHARAAASHGRLVVGAYLTQNGRVSGIAADYSWVEWKVALQQTIAWLQSVHKTDRQTDRFIGAYRHRRTPYICTTANLMKIAKETRPPRPVCRIPLNAARLSNSRLSRQRPRRCRRWPCRRRRQASAPRALCGSTSLARSSRVLGLMQT